MTDAYAKTLVLHTNKKRPNDSINDTSLDDKMRLHIEDELPSNDEVFTQSYSYLT